MEIIQKIIYNNFTYNQLREISFQLSNVSNEINGRILKYELLKTAKSKFNDNVYTEFEDFLNSSKIKHDKYSFSIKNNNISYKFKQLHPNSLKIILIINCVDIYCTEYKWEIMVCCKTKFFEQMKQLDTLIKDKYEHLQNVDIISVLFDDFDYEWLVDIINDVSTHFKFDQSNSKCTSCNK